jgi:archaellum component FlaC
LKKYNKTVGRTADENEDVEKSFKEAKKEADKLEKEVKDLTAEYRRLAGAGEDVDLELEGMDDIAEANAEMENMADTTEEMGEEGSEALDGLNENAMTTSELITTAGEAVMGLAATF